MELINEADKVVRTFLPVVLEAAGRNECARELRDSEPLSSPASVIRAALILNELSESEFVEGPWQHVVEDALFWCEAAVWAATRQDMKSFADHVNRANDVMREGLALKEICQYH